MINFKPTKCMIEDKLKFRVSFSIKGYKQDVPHLYIPKGMPLRGVRVNILVDEVNRIVCIEEHKEGVKVSDRGSLHIRKGIVEEVLKTTRYVYFELYEDGKWYGSY